MRSLPAVGMTELNKVVLERLLLPIAIGRSNDDLGKNYWGQEPGYQVLIAPQTLITCPLT